MFWVIRKKGYHGLSGGLKLLLITAFFFFRLPSAQASNLTGINLGSDGDGVGISFALKDQATLVFSYFNANTAALEYGQYQNSTFSTEIVDSSLISVPTTNVDSNITVTSSTALVLIQGVPHIVYFNSRSGELRHAWKAGGVWNKETIDVLSQGGGNPAAVACGASLCISYFDNASKNLRFAKGIQGSWSLETVDSSPSSVGAMSDIAVKPDGLPVIAYYDASNYLLKAAVKLQSGKWSIEQLPNLGYHYGLYPSIAVGTDGSIHISASHYKNTSTKSDSTVYYAVKESNGGWLLSPISDSYAGGSTSIVLDSSNNPHVAYRYLRYNTIYGDESAVEVASLTSSGLWQFERLSGEYGSAGAIYDYK
ncbi:MAG: hypothetical protein D6780_03285, partial [Candidatus Dadabacteria bacterium]